jgi:predicted kinase
MRSPAVDNTRPSPQDRAPLIAIGRAHGALLRAGIVRVPLAVCLARNAMRTGRARVPDRGTLATRKRLMAPSAAEGLDRVDVVYA